MEKDEKCNGIPDPIRNPNSEFVLLKFLCYTIKLSMMNRFDRSDIVIPNIDPIQYHQDAKVIPLNLQKSNFAYLWSRKKRKNSIMEVNIIAFIATSRLQIPNRLASSTAASWLPWDQAWGAGDSLALR